MPRPGAPVAASRPISVRRRDLAAVMSGDLGPRVEVGWIRRANTRQHVLGRDLGGRVQNPAGAGEDPQDIEPPGLVGLIASGAFYRAPATRSSSPG